MHPAVTNGSYDIARIREDFPILSMQVYGKPLVYLDNAASAQKPTAVLDRMNQAYTTEYANVHRGLHYLANAATEGYEGAREKVRAFLNAKRPEEIIFTRNATEAINLVAYTFARERIQPGDGASGNRHAGYRLRFLRDHRPQALWSNRYRRAVWQIRTPCRDAAVQRRRRDDQGSVRGSHHLWRSAAQVRGWHAADRAGD